MSNNSVEYYIQLVEKKNVEIDELKKELSYRDGVIDGLMKAIEALAKALKKEW